MVVAEGAVALQEHLRNMVGIAMWFFIGAIAYTLWQIIFFETEGRGKRIFWKTGHGIARDIGDFLGPNSSLTTHLVPEHMLTDGERVNSIIGARQTAATNYFKKRDFRNLREQVARAQREAMDLVMLESDVRGKVRGSLNAQIRRFADNKEQENLIMAYQKNILDPLENLLQQILEYEELAKDAAARQNKQDEIRANMKVEELAKEIQDKLKDWKTTYEVLKQVFTAQKSELQAARIAEEEGRKKKEDAEARAKAANVEAKRKVQEAAAPKGKSK